MKLPGVDTETFLKTASLHQEYPAKAEASMSVEVVLQKNRIKFYGKEKASQSTSRIPSSTHRSKQEAERKDQNSKERKVNPSEEVSELVSASAFKETKATKCGVCFKKHNGAVLVSKVIDGGLFEATPLKVGDEVLHINYVSVLDMNAKQVANLLRDAEGEVKVCAKRPSSGTEQESKTPPGSETKSSYSEAVSEERDDLIHL